MSMVILGRYAPDREKIHDLYGQKRDDTGGKAGMSDPQNLQEAELVEIHNDLRLMDVERAISDMKRDHILEDYLYFVGSQKHLA